MKRTSRRQGQIVILMGMMATTFVIMFGLVVSIGHLVQAKINLQNAVDLAAMSGASYQARYLNHLSEINYRFRQNVKWVLFDLYFTQSRFNQGLRAEVMGGGPFTLMRDNRMAFGICQQAYGYKPMTAAGEIGNLRTKDTFDLCQNVTGGPNLGRVIPRFAPSPVIVPDPRIIIANLEIARLAKEAEEIFRTGTDNNPRYFYYAIEELESRQEHQLRQFHNVITEMQAAFGDGPGPLRPGSFSADGVMARTFGENLINANRNASIEYLNGKETLTVSLSDFSPAVVGFSVPTVVFDTAGSGGVQTTIRTVSRNGIPSGYARKRQSNERFPQNPTMVMLKATARPRLLFWPQSLTPTITAFAVAKPFGSKVGPPKSFYEDENPPTPRAVANMSLYVGDNLSSLTGASGFIPGVGHKQFARTVLSLLPRGIGSGRNELRPDASGSCPGSFGCMARSPTQYEGIMFNTFVPTAGDQFYLAISDLGFSSPVGNLGYVLKDRPGVLSGLHKMEFAGIAPYYATKDSALTSWAPAPAISDPGSRRIGYSIKLISMHDACKEMGTTGGAGASPELTYFCQPEHSVMH